MTDDRRTPDAGPDRAANTNAQSGLDIDLDAETSRSDTDLPDEDVVSADLVAMAEGEDDDMEGYDPSQRAEILEAHQNLGGHPVIQNRLQEDLGDPDGRSLS